ncbi:ECF RNA polymerase sigma factor SigD [Aliidongia dinghuensis]|uniref:ECF RNA polymerase sigma factor SigD n=1 Tax=Aliidongia dinghuensis TaxID=1867774 RepID=A0A8J2YQV4_9PROT|nr:sigma-70 family RNA polymerase sigma factor [Aliidongia dinghuensis]GGF06612.1 ECF RNA polymerase sigma factor SigD [Aliidongia dinghuensis]
MPDDDSEDWSTLMARAQDGDGASYRRLLLAITPYVRAIAMGRLSDADEVEDGVQDVLLTVHAIRQTYDPRRPFKPWLAGVARHRLVDFRRRRARSSGREVTLDADDETFVAPASNLEEGAGDSRPLHAAIQALPAGQRQAIELLKLRELSLKEASAVSGMSAAALKVASHRAMQRLRQLLGLSDSRP